MNLGTNITHECLVSQSVGHSVFHQVWNAVSDGQMVCLKKMFNRKIMFHLNRRLKKLLLQGEGLIQNTVKFLTEKNLRTFLSSTKHLLACTKYRVAML